MSKEILRFTAAAFFAGSILSVKESQAFAQESRDSGLTVKASCDPIALDVQMVSPRYRGIAIRVTDEKSGDDAYPAWERGNRINYSAIGRVDSLVEEQPPLQLKPGASLLVEALRISRYDFWHHLVENWVLIKNRIKVLAQVSLSLNCKNPID